MPRAMPVMSSAFDSANSGPSSFSICVFSQRSSRVATASREAPVSRSSAMMRTPRMQRVLGRDNFRHRVTSPADGAVGGQHELIVGRSAQLFGPRVDLARQHLLGGGLQRLGIGACFRRIGRKGKAVEPADGVALDDDFAGLADFSSQTRILPQAAHQYTGTAVNETLRKPFMQGI